MNFIDNKSTILFYIQQVYFFIDPLIFFYKTILSYFRFMYIIFINKIDKRLHFKINSFKPNNKKYIFDELKIGIEPYILAEPKYFFVEPKHKK